MSRLKKLSRSFGANLLALLGILLLCWLIVAGIMWFFAWVILEIFRLMPI